MQGTILDLDTFDRNDVNLGAFLDLPVQWDFYRSTSPKQVVERIRHCDLIVTNKAILNRDNLASAKHLKLILIAATGTDNIDLAFCRSSQITVCNVRHYATPAVAQHTLGLILNLLTSQIRYTGDIRSGKWSDSPIFCLLDHPITELEGRTLGIIGYGVLGRRVARLAEAFGMRILIGQRPGGTSVPGRWPLHPLLAQSDIVSLHCPLTPDTHHLIGRDEFTCMKRTAVIINTARGAIVDSEALVAALKQGEIYGAGIDVLESEPPPRSHVLLQPDIPNLIVTPHNAWASRESRQRLVDQLRQNLAGWLQGSPINTV